MTSRTCRVLMLTAVVATFALTPSESQAWGRHRGHQSRGYYSQSTSFSRPYSSPGYEYRYRRAQARTAVGYNQLFSF